MSDTVSKPEIDSVRPQQDQEHADVSEPVVEAGQNTKMKHRIDQPERLSAPYQLPAFRDLERLSNAIRDEEVDFTKFCETLGEVPQVKNLILRDARSILAGSGSRIETTRHAVAMLGLRRIRLMLSQLAEPYEDLTTEDHDLFKKEVVRVSA
ncbi:MAG: HDOD domain-containing protein [Fuerstiella sp.]